MNSVAFYQPGDSAAGDRERLTLQLVPDLSDAVNLCSVPRHARFQRSDPRPVWRDPTSSQGFGRSLHVHKMWIGRLAKPYKLARHPSLCDALL